MGLGSAPATKPAGLDWWPSLCNNAETIADIFSPLSERSLTMCKIRSLVLSVAAKLDWLPGLLSRLTIGGVFIQSGWGKLHHLDKVVQFFTSLGIPAPQIQAPF